MASNQSIKVLVLAGDNISISEEEVPQHIAGSNNEHLIDFYKDRSKLEEKDFVVVVFMRNTNKVNYLLVSDHLEFKSMVLDNSE